MTTNLNGDSVGRREFLAASAGVGLAAAFAACGLESLSAADKKSPPPAKKPDPLFKISVTEYSLHRMIARKELDNLDYFQCDKWHCRFLWFYWF